MFAILLGALIAADVPVEPAADAPKGQPPRILTASVKGEQLVSRQKVTVTVPITVQEKIVVNGQEQVVTKTAYRTEERMQELTWDLKKATISTAGGKKLDLDDLKKQLDKPRPIVFSSDGKAIDAAYLKLFDKDVIVIVAPRAPARGSEGPAPKR
jgi:hypothetical protein